MKRVMIVGGPGAGKSTLARMLGEKTGLPVIHIDHIHWKSGWIERTRDEKDRLTREIHARDAWIFEGGHSRTYADRLRRADTFIFLDIPVTLRIWRVLRRSWVYRGMVRPDLPEGCPERFDGEMIEFLHFILTSRKRSRARHVEILESPPAHLETYRLSGRREIEDFLDGVGRTARTQAASER